MKVIVYDWHTEMFPTDVEVKRLCTPGKGADTCIWLLMSGNGWECAYNNKPAPLMERWRNNETNAKRDGCEPIKNWIPTESGETLLI